MVGISAVNLPISIKLQRVTTPLIILLDKNVAVNNQIFNFLANTQFDWN